MQSLRSKYCLWINSQFGYTTVCICWVCLFVCVCERQRQKVVFDLEVHGQIYSAFLLWMFLVENYIWLVSPRYEKNRQCYLPCHYATASHCKCLIKESHVETHSWTRSFIIHPTINDTNWLCWLKLKQTNFTLPWQWKWIITSTSVWDYLMLRSACRALLFCWLHNYKDTNEESSALWLNQPCAHIYCVFVLFF